MPTPAMSARVDTGVFDAVFARLAERVTAGHIPTAALAVGDAEGPIRTATFTADPRQSISPDSYFFLASVSKPIFATAIMQLVEDGLLDLHQPVQRHLPEFAGRGKERVTAWHLLTHTSGVPDIPTEAIRRERPSAARMTQLTLSAELRFEPGSRWEYCTASYYLLALLVERLTGLRYPDYLRRRVFEPLGMQSTFDPRGKGRPLVRVHGVGADNRIIRFLLLRYVASIAAPGGGLWGTLDDLLTFGAALLRPRPVGGRDVPLAPATVALMTSDQLSGLPGNDEGRDLLMHAGLGWAKPTLMDPTLPGSPRVVAHGGATGTRLWIDPQAELVFVFFTNQWNPDRDPEFEALRGTYAALAAR